MADIRTMAMDLRRSIGQGRPISQERAGRLLPVPVAFPSFERGIDLRDVEQDQDGTSTQEGLNFEVQADGDLMRTAGHLMSETMTGGRVIRDMLLQTSLDFTTELLMFDSPYMGVKSTGSTTWFNASLPAGNQWAGVSNLEKVLLTNGANGIYTRDFGVNTVSLVTDSPSGLDLANFAGRVWVLGPTYPAGTYQALGIGWSADAEGLDWTGIGNGAQLLIADTTTDDRGVALRPISFDLLAVLCQRSIWTGRPTGDLYEPAIFEPRVQGVGCMSRATACLAPMGVIFLSESGVYLFDGNGVKLLSAAINPALLPVLTNTPESYTAVYDNNEARYILFTPTCTWVYEVKYDRWLKWGFRATKAVAFSEQFSGVTWDNILATWDTYGETWSSIGPALGQQRVVYAYDTDLAVPSRSSSTFVDGSSAAAYYGFLRRDTGDVNSLYETQRVRLRYLGAEPSLGVYLPDNSGAMTLVSTKTLGTLSRQDGVELGVRSTGRGVGAQLHWSDESLRISKAEIVGMARGHKQGVL